MKRIWLVCFTLVWVGCGGSDEVTPPGDLTTQLESVESNETDEAGSDNGPQTERIPPELQAEQKLASQMQDLARRANELEQAEKFLEAAEVWSEVTSRLESEFGAECWQSANARLAHSTAQLQAGFNEEQRQSLRRITNLQKQLGSAIRENEGQIAARLSQQSVALSTEVFGESSPVTAKQRHQFARLLKALELYPEAARVYERALLDLSLHFAEVHPDLIVIHEDLAEIYGELNQPARQIDHLRSATSQASRIWGDQSLQYAKRANQLGVAYHETGQDATAEKILQAAEAIRRMELGSDHVQVGHSLLNIGTVQIDLKKYPDSIANLQRSLDVFNTSDKWRDWQNVALEKLATAYMLAGQPADAEPILAQRLQRASEAMGPDDVDVAELQYRYAIALGRQGKYDAAEQALQQAIRTQQDKLGLQHSSTARSIAAYTLLLKQTGREAEAEQLQLRLRTAQAPSGEFQPR